MAAPAVEAGRTAEVRTTKVGLKRRLSRYRWLYLMLVPGVVYFILFKYWPMYGLRIAFQNYIPILGYDRSPWVGLKWFIRLFTTPDFTMVMGNTLILAALNIIFCFPAPIIVALLLNELRVSVLKRVVQTAIYIPHFLSWTIVASLTYLLFKLGDGAITVVAQSIIGSDPHFLTSPEWFRPVIIIQTLWKSTGWGTIIYLAALAGVDQNLYEAARIDGANRFQQLWHVTLPAIRSTIVVMVILMCGNLLDTGFEQIFLMTNALNRSVAQVFDTFVYYVGITNGSYSYATAVGMFKSVVGVILIFGANAMAKRFGQSGLF